MLLLQKIFSFNQSKHYLFLSCFVLFSFAGFTQQTGVINNGAKIVVTEGAFFRIQGSGANYINESYETLPGRIDLDGILEVDGNWLNNASSGFVFGDYLNAVGTVIFKGNQEQTIGGDLPTTFESIHLHNGTGLNLSNQVQVENELLLDTGNIVLNDYHLILDTGGVINGTFSSASMIVTNGDGILQKNIVSNGAYLFPIGDISSEADYTPVEVTLNNGNLSSAWIGAHVTNAQHPGDESVEEYIERYWTLTSDGITNPDYDAGFKYTDQDITGDETVIYAATFDASSNRTLFYPVESSSNTMNYTGLTDFYEFTGVDGTSPEVTISSTISETTETSPVPVTIEFSEQITMLGAEDITIENGEVSNITTADYVLFSADITPLAQGTVTVSIPQGVTTDLPGNPNNASNTFEMVYESSVGLDLLGPSEVSIYAVDREVVVDFGQEKQILWQKAIVEIYNLLGQRVLSREIPRMNQFRTTVNSSSKVFIVKVIIDGDPYSRRVFVR
ncbi:MAG: Ig-like domain-containing protein [Bacteroidales bacterium]|jgi:hypothetical protein|nr:Ig-like domain-containing protein [Bacteroidales bacterium]